MARTRYAPFTDRARLLVAGGTLGAAAALLAGCGGGGASDGPGSGGSSAGGSPGGGFESSPAVEGSQSADQRESPGGGGGGFDTAGQLSGNVTGVWPNPQVTVKNDATSGTFTGVVTKVYDCTPGEPQVQAKPVGSTKLTLPAGSESGYLGFTFPTDTATESHKVCALITADDGSTKTVSGGVIRQEDLPNGGGTGSSPESPESPTVRSSPDVPDHPDASASPS